MIWFWHWPPKIIGQHMSNDDWSGIRHMKSFESIVEYDTVIETLKVVARNGVLQILQWDAQEFGNAVVDDWHWQLSDGENKLPSFFSCFSSAISHSLDGLGNCSQGESLDTRTEAARHDSWFELEWRGPKLLIAESKTCEHTEETCDLIETLMTLCDINSTAWQTFWRQGGTMFQTCELIRYDGDTAVEKFVPHSDKGQSG